MKNIKQLSLAAITLSMVASSGVGYAITAKGSTYMGVDIVYNSMKFKQDYGHNVLSKKAAPGLNLSVGHMFYNNFGAEVGFEIEKNMKRTARLNKGEKIGGQLLDNPLLSYITYNSTLRQHHAYIGAFYKHSIFNNTFVSFMLAGSLSYLSANYIVMDSFPGGSNGTTRSFSKNKLIPLIKCSIEHKITNSFGIKALLGWKNTSAIKMTARETTGHTIKPKNTISMALGATYNF
jgi:hypothetical protein